MASADLARGMVGQLISSCWRADKCAKDWMSNTKSVSAGHRPPIQSVTQAVSSVGFWVVPVLISNHFDQPT